MERIVLDDIFDDDGKWAIMPSEVVEALKKAYHELDTQQLKIDALIEIFDDLQETQKLLQEISRKTEEMVHQPFWSHKLIAELAEPKLRD